MAEYSLSKCPVCDLHAVQTHTDDKGNYLPLDPMDCIQAQSKKIEGLKDNIVSLAKIIAATNEKFKELEKETGLMFNELRKQIQELT